MAPREWGESACKEVGEALASTVVASYEWTTAGPEEDGAMIGADGGVWNSGVVAESYVPEFRAKASLFLHTRHHHVHLSSPVRGDSAKHNNAPRQHDQLVDTDPLHACIHAPTEIIPRFHLASASV